MISTKSTLKLNSGTDASRIGETYVLSNLDASAFNGQERLYYINGDSGKTILNRKVKSIIPNAEPVMSDYATAYTNFLTGYGGYINNFAITHIKSDENILARKYRIPIDETLIYTESNQHGTWLITEKRVAILNDVNGEIINDHGKYIIVSIARYAKIGITDYTFGPGGPIAATDAIEIDSINKRILMVHTYTQLVNTLGAKDEYIGRPAWNDASQTWFIPVINSNVYYKLNDSPFTLATINSTVANGGYGRLIFGSNPKNTKLNGDRIYSDPEIYYAKTLNTPTMFSWKGFIWNLLGNGTDYSYFGHIDLAGVMVYQTMPIIGKKLICVLVDRDYSDACLIAIGYSGISDRDISVYRKKEVASAWELAGTFALAGMQVPLGDSNGLIYANGLYPIYAAGSSTNLTNDNRFVNYYPEGSVSLKDGKLCFGYRYYYYEKFDPNTNRATTNIKTPIDVITFFKGDITDFTFSVYKETLTGGMLNSNGTSAGFATINHTRMINAKSRSFLKTDLVPFIPGALNNSTASTNEQAIISPDFLWAYADDNWDLPTLAHHYSTTMDLIYNSYELGATIPHLSNGEDISLQGTLLEVQASNAMIYENTSTGVKWSSGPNDDVAVMTKIYAGSKEVFLGGVDLRATSFFMSILPVSFPGDEDVNTFAFTIT